MQSVWDQRGKKQRDRMRENIEIVVETQDSYDKKEAAKARRRPSAVPVQPEDAQTASKGGSPSTEAVPGQIWSNTEHLDSSISELANQLAVDTDISRSAEDEAPVQIQIDSNVQREIEQAAMETLARRNVYMDRIDMAMLDPFQRACILVNSRTNAYLHHYFQALSWKFTMPKRIWLRHAMEDPGMMHSVLFIASAHHGFTVHKSRTLTIDARWHASKTIQYIKKGMQDPGRQFSDPVIGAIARIITWSLIQGDRETFAKHMHHVSQLIQRRGGLDALGFDGQLKYLMCCNTFGGASIWMSDIPESLRYPYGLLNQSALEDVPDVAIPAYSASSFEALNGDGWVPTDLADICTALAKIDATLSDPNNPLKTNENAQSQYGHCSNKLALRLIYDSQREAQRFTGGVPGIDVFIREITRITLLCYLFVFHRDVPPFSQPLVLNLRRIRQWMEKSKSLPNLKVSNAWGGGKLGGLLFWSLMITGAITLNASDKADIMQELRTVADAMKINVWQRVQTVCRTYLWQQPLCERKCALFWNDVFYFQPIGLMQELSLGRTSHLVEERPSTSSTSSSSNSRSAFRRGRSDTIIAPSHLTTTGKRPVTEMNDPLPSPQMTVPSLSTDDGSASSSSEHSASVSPPLQPMKYSIIQETPQHGSKRISRQLQPQNIRFQEPYVGDRSDKTPRRNESSAKRSGRRPSMDDAPPKMRKMNTT